MIPHESGEYGPSGGDDFMGVSDNEAHESPDPIVDEVSQPEHEPDVEEEEAPKTTIPSTLTRGKSTHSLEFWTDSQPQFIEDSPQKTPAPTEVPIPAPDGSQEGQEDEVPDSDRFTVEDKKLPFIPSPKSEGKTSQELSDGGIRDPNEMKHLVEQLNALKKLREEQILLVSFSELFFILLY